MEPKVRNEQVLSWRIDERSDHIFVELTGEIDENAELDELRQRLSGPVTFHLAGVRRINSCGVREWLGLMRDLAGAADLTFTHCSTVFVNQMNTIHNFRGNARVESFHAPYICESCELEVDRLIDVSEHFGDGNSDTVPSFPCERCGDPMELDDFPRRYLSFLHYR